MKLIFRIEYRTRWGENLVLRRGGRRYAMHYAADGIWQAEVDARDWEFPAEYGYEVVSEGGARLRGERLPHRLRLPEGFADGTLTVLDRWNDMPEDWPLRSLAFTRGMLGRRTGAECAAADGNVTLRCVCPALLPDEVLAVVGSGEELGGWRRAVPMDDSRFPEWSVTLRADCAFEYKFLIADRRTLAPRVWEEGGNRIRTEVPREGAHLLDASALPRFPERRLRSAGTAVPVFSLRSGTGFGVGEFCDLKKMADWAVATGQRIIQLLPINDTTMDGTWRDSYPYNANSTFALHPQYLDLPAAGVPEDEEYVRLRDELNASPVLDYERVNREKLRLLRRTFAREGGRTVRSAAYRRFFEANRSWLLPYAVFSALRDENGTADFTRWGEYARYDTQRAEAYRRSHEAQTAFYCFLQYHLHVQLTEACAYAHARGVVLKGDLPIGISRTSVDAWVAPHLFHMDSQAGAPPDAFSAYGQNWGFPTYDWERMAEDDYAWWRARLKKMAEYFDAFRIDHILGFFRIWEIPAHSVRGLLGHFNPAMSYSADELRALGFDLSGGRYTVPKPDARGLAELFGDRAEEVRRKYLSADGARLAFATQREVCDRLPGYDPWSVQLREGLMTLLEEVLFVEDPRRPGFYHPRIAAHATRLYRSLDEAHRAAFDRLYEDFFYRRHNGFWRDSALRKLPALITATSMLACGEDLGMIPASVPETMRELRILSLEIQRMPKAPGREFDDPADYPYLAVCSTSTHDMNPLRAWWEEDRGATQRFYEGVLGMRGEAPRSCTPAICRRIVGEHLASPAMFAILPWQDWMSVDAKLRRPDPADERINIPSVACHRWCYRMHITLEELLRADELNGTLRDMIVRSGRM